MSTDDLQRVWQSQDCGARIAIDPEVLLREVRRNSEGFRQAVLRRDIIEAGMAVIMAGVCAYLALTGAGWPMWLIAASMLWIAGFMSADRIRHKRKTLSLGKPILLCVQSSLEDVAHQIRLLENVFWWYLLPPGAAIAVYYGYVAWLARSAPWGFLLVTAARTVLPTILVFLVVWWLNRRAVRTELVPRKRELQELLLALANDEEEARTQEDVVRERHDSNRKGDSTI